MKRTVEPSCIKGYRIVVNGAGKLELTDEGEKYGCPDPFIANCINSEGLCWWLKPIGFAFTITLPVTSLRKFYLQTDDEGMENADVD